MATEPLSKKAIWKSIFRLIVPERKTFLLVVFISILSTGVSLIEPLIYREAINDIAGLFVRQAREDTRRELGVDEEEDPISSFIGKQFSSEPDSVVEDSLSVAADSVVTDSIATDSLSDNLKAKPVHKPKRPHKRNRVAGRTPDQALNTLMWAVVLMFGVSVIGYGFRYLGDNLNVKLACGIEQGFIQRTFGHVLRLPLGFFGKRSSGALAKQINQQEEVSGIVNGFSQQILPEIISLIGILAIMFWQNVTLTFISLAIIPFYLFIAWRSATRLESGLASYYEQWEEVSARIQDALGGIKTVKLSGAEAREVQRFQKAADGAYVDYVKRSRLAHKYIFWESVLTRISSTLVLGYGGYLTLKHRLTPGDVVMFVAYLDRLYDPLDALSSLWVELQQNIASITRAFKLVDNNVEEQKGKELIVKQGKVEFKNVHFSYVPEREILKGMSFSVEPGKVTAIVGGSGSGKTTAVDLIMKLYAPSSGEILIDGENIINCDAASVRSQIGIVNADGSIFRGTLADNIRYKKPDATDDEVRAAAIAAGMEGTLQRLPDGLQTTVGESGIGLSVGERQRVQIARVLVSQPKILVLDEATANLDFATEAEVKKTVNEIRKENTVIVIAHRYSMVRDADYVLVFGSGVVLEQGTPQELIEKGGWFHNFANAAEGREDIASEGTGDAEEDEGEEETGEEGDESIQ
jgi:ABC-type multidrug transport system fused ATPase/permease subunit